jgi:hypothetical protein
MELKHTSLCSQRPAISPYPQPDQFIPRRSILLFQENLKLSISSKRNIFLSSGFPAKILNTPLTHACDIPRQSHTPRFDRRNSFWWGTDVMTLLTKEFPLDSCYFLSLRHKCHQPMNFLNGRD